MPSFFHQKLGPSEACDNTKVLLYNGIWSIVCYCFEDMKRSSTSVGTDSKVQYWCQILVALTKPPQILKNENYFIMENHCIIGLGHKCFQLSP